MSNVEMINSPEVAAPIGPYSHAALAGGFLYCTGQLPLTPDGELVTGPAAEQARQCLDNLAGVCAAAGSSLENVIRVCIYLDDLSQFPAVNEVYAAALPQLPARTTIEVSALPMGAGVEMDAVAFVG